MTTYFLRIPPKEVVRLVRAERDAAGGQPELYEDASKDYVIEEEYDRRAYGLSDGDNGGTRYDLVTAQAVLNVEPRIERDFWVLSVVVRKNLGPRIVDEERALVATALTLDAFESEFLAPGAGTVSVRLETQTPVAKRHFDDWWTALSARHAPAAARIRPVPSPQRKPAERSPAMTVNQAAANPAAMPAAEDPWSGRVREAVGVFADADALEAAVDALEIAGFDRARISVLGADEAVKARIGRLYRSVAEIEDDPRAPHAAFVSRDSRAEGRAAAVAIPLYIGGFAGAAAIAATGGALAVAIAATMLGAAAGASLGVVLADAVARHHEQRIRDQIAQGGVVLWVGLADANAEKRALDVLTRAGAKDIHVHEIERRWRAEDSPLAHARLDPFLDRDPISGSGAV